MQSAGIILAAGASTRMGRPKALLELSDGTPLAVAQYRLLEEGGCEPVIVVLGCDYDQILPRITVCRVVYNVQWEEGRFSSVQTGLRAIDADGYLILPVDTVGVRAETIRFVRTEAERRSPRALRPVYHGQSARMAWISRAAAQDLLKMDPCGGATRLDEILSEWEEKLSVDDPNVLSNVNTAEDWSAFLARSKSVGGTDAVS